MQQLFIAIKLTPPLLYLMKRGARGRLLTMRLKERFSFEEIQGELYLGTPRPLATVSECKRVHSELLKALFELSPQVDEKEMRLYIVPQKILCSSSSDQALLEEQKF